jgi:hypothetical protein
VSTAFWSCLSSPKPRRERKRLDFKMYQINI